jgi:hypothetical protein
MKPFLITLFLLSSLMAEQNSSMAFGTKAGEQNSFKTFKQADGSSFEGISRGKDFFTYIELSNGYTCLYNKATKTYEYAVVNDGKLVPSGISVTAGTVPKDIEKLSQEDLKKLQEEAFKTHL